MEWNPRANSTGASKDIKSPLNDRRSFKNVSIYITELPPTPNTFRDKYHRGREQATRLQPTYSSIRPQTYQMNPIPQVRIGTRPETLDFADTRLKVLKTGSKSRITALPLPLVIQHKELGAGGEEQDYDESAVKIADTLTRGAAAFNDHDFTEEVKEVGRYFTVISEAERTAMLYALLQQASQAQIQCFARVLENHFI